MRFIALIRSIATLVCATSVAASQAQCPGCSPDLSCTVDPAFPVLCPETAPEATVGQYYEEDFTFWMPANFTDPGSGFAVTLLQLTVTGVSGMPFGLQFTTNSPTGVYYPQDNEFGCARICGTPFGAGEFTVTISVVANVSASGITLDVPTSFPVILTVLPGAGGNTSFSYAPTSGCGSVTATFQALIDGSPSPTSYAWDFGNGNTSTAAQPPPQLFTPDGVYQVSLQTTIGGYVLQTVDLVSVNGNWCGDVEEPNLPLIGCTGSPDPYFVLTNASGGTYTSSAFSDVFTGLWTDLNLLLDNPPYSISFYDEDVVSGDDLLGTYNIPITGDGTYFFNVAGGTAGSLVITNEPQQVFNDTALVTVFSLPEVVLTQNQTTSELCATDSGLASYTWLLDGQPVPDETGPCLLPSGPGVWQVVGFNGFGCSDTSNAIVVCPVFSIAQNGNVLFVPSGYATYAWTYNGAPISGSSPFVFLQGDGLYGVVVDAGNGCTLTLTFLWDTTGLPEASVTDRRMEVFPVPSDGLLNVVADGLQSNLAIIQVLDPSGRLVHERRAQVVQGRLREALALQLAPGAYSVRINDGSRAMARRVMFR
ncbi:MAG TPA: PKD domain-containing protein [Flavobacteriales bacterium]|nr:PKD domain-containing protein [Flavobacteriales bacterium]